ncbi:MAG: RDD family protein [Bacteroidetes bacterium]|jgi:uncharacterized RDD family membrane protein YckC|nr:MAG: RDD family protein [Bacteroidota bacterium]
MASSIKRCWKATVFNNMDIEPQYPDLKTRIQSAFVDGILMILLMFATAWILDKAGIGDEEETGLIKGIIFVGIWGIYEPLSTTLGATLGNYLMKIRVRKAGSLEKKINIIQAFIRFIFKFSLGWLSFLTMHFNGQRRAIHDFVAGSVMVEK